MNDTHNFVITLGPAPSADQLKPEWSDLETRAQGSFFTSWAWIGAWLDMLGGTQGLALVRVTKDAETVGLGLLGRTPLRMRDFGRRRWLLNQTGRPSFDSIYIEYNDVLLAAATATDARAACVQYLAAAGGLRVAAAVSDMVQAIAEVPHRRLRLETCDYVDLTGFETGIDAFLSTLGQNARPQIRRAMNLAAAGADLQVHRAADPVSAAAALKEMAALHTAGWQDRKGLPGAFSNPNFTRFVAGLIERETDAGAVDVLRIGTPARTLGILLNFVHRGEVYAYQSGFAYTDDNRFKPGLASHALAIAYYRARGYRGYHFMAGAARYKQTLSNARETLGWSETRPRDVLSRVEDLCHMLWRQLRRTT